MCLLLENVSTIGGKWGLLGGGGAAASIMPRCSFGNGGKSRCNRGAKNKRKGVKFQSSPQEGCGWERGSKYLRF